MIERMLQKLENPTRIKELAPKETLLRVGLTDKMNVCDIGAGTGIFAKVVAEMTCGKVYALERSADMVKFLQNVKNEKSLRNLYPLEVTDAKLPVEACCCDMVLLVTVLHEVEDKTEMLCEIDRILKPDGKLIIIEFHYYKTPMGPPLNHRISPVEIDKVVTATGLVKSENILLGENLFCSVYLK